MMDRSYRITPDGWTTVFITAAAHALIRANAQGTFKDTGRPVDGGFMIPLEEETVAAVNAQAMAGETFSDVLIRLFALQASGGRRN